MQTITLYRTDFKDDCGDFTPWTDLMEQLSIGLNEYDEEAEEVEIRIESIGTVLP